MTKKNRGKTPKIDQRYQLTWQRFNANMESLWIFSDEMVNSADEWDRKLVEKLSTDIADLFNADIDEVKQEVMAYLPSLDSEEFEPLYLGAADVRETIGFIESGEFKRRAQNWLVENPRKQHKFLEVFRKIFRQPPANGILLRRSAFIMLVSFFEFLLTDLQVTLWLINPDPSINVPENLSDEIERDAWLREYISQKRFSINDLLENILENSGFSIDSKLRNNLDVIRERRNLLIHKDGVVDQNYLTRKLPPSEKTKMEPHLRRRWWVSSAYLRNSLEQIHLLGIMLIMGCWKYSVNGISAQAACELLGASFLGLTNKRYGFVTQLGKFAETINLPKKRQYRDIIRVNWAIALQRSTGDPQEIKAVLEKLQKSRSPIILMAKYILLNQLERALRKLQTIKRSENLHEVDFDWPLFEPFWEDLRFKRLFHGNVGTATSFTNR